MLIWMVMKPLLLVCYWLVVYGVGAAFRAANMSRAFKTRFIGMTDYNPYSIKLHLYRDQAQPSDTLEEGDEMLNGILSILEWSCLDFIQLKGPQGYTLDLFKKGGNYKSQKTTSFHAYKDFNIHIYYNDTTQLSKGNVYALLLMMMN